MIQNKTLHLDKKNARVKFLSKGIDTIPIVILIILVPIYFLTSAKRPIFVDSKGNLINFNPVRVLFRTNLNSNLTS